MFISASMHILEHVIAFDPTWGYDLCVYRWRFFFAFP